MQSTNTLAAKTQSSTTIQTYDSVIIGGGPAGATAATDLAKQGLSVLLLDRAGRIKPCGGAIPPIAIEEFTIPRHLLKARIQLARAISPTQKQVDMPIDGGYVGMVDREEFDEWLRVRAANQGASGKRVLLFASTGTATVPL
ncbi:MAG: FAD-dependent oxidoreductase [Pseudohongiellaceae bacterium]